MTNQRPIEEIIGEIRSEYPVGYTIAEIFREYLETERRQADERLREVVSDMMFKCPDHATEHYYQPDGTCELCKKYQTLNVYLEVAAAKHNIDITRNE
jgi:hypothetical protein